MQYQLLNIVNIKEGKITKILKKLILAAGILMEIMILVNFIRMILSGEASYADNIMSLIITPVLWYILSLEMNYDHLDEALLMLDFQEDYLLLTYPNKENKRKGQAIVHKIKYGNINKYEYDEEHHIITLEYNYELNSYMERIYLKDKDKEKIKKAFDKYIEEWKNNPNREKQNTKRSDLELY